MLMHLRLLYLQDACLVNSSWSLAQGKLERLGCILTSYSTLFGGWSALVIDHH